MSSVIPATTDPPRPEARSRPGESAPLERPSAGGLKRLRGLCDGLACLAIAVLLLRSFLVEGYMISTGSMAPALLGYHKRVVCPRCGARFAHGIPPGRIAGAEAVDTAGGRNPAQTRCPNCGQGGIAIAQVPRNHGDQLLVFKQAFRIHQPRRWEIAVFHNPNNPSKAFVKRIVGLPGEAIQVRDGNVFADGTICRKSLAMQRAMGIPVYLSANRPPATAQHRWIAPRGGVRRPAPGVFQLAAGEQSDTDARDPATGWIWLGYHHRRPVTGERITAVPLTNLPLGFELPSSLHVASVRFLRDESEPDAGSLSVRGPLSSEAEALLRELSAEPAYQQAISQLAEESRHPAITDEYGYNGLHEDGRNAVGDLMVTGRLRLAGKGRLAVEITADGRRFRTVIDTRRRTISLRLAQTGQVLRSAELVAPVTAAEGVPWAMSVMDRQVLVALGGELAFAPWRYESVEVAPFDGKPPVRLGAKGLEVRISELNLYRDVYYTPGRGHNGIDSPCQLAAREYFVLGDNSPISLDSRDWDDPTVSARLLIGKPFVVHLPSRPVTFQIGPAEYTLRIPDFSRMRYIE